MNLNEITSIIGSNVKTFVTKDRVPEIINNQQLIGGLILSSELGDDSIVPYIVLNNGHTRRLDGGTYQYLKQVSGSLKNAYDNFNEWSHLIENTYSYSLDILSQTSQITDDVTGKITYLENTTNEFYRDTYNTVSELNNTVITAYNNMNSLGDSIIAQTSYFISQSVEHLNTIYNPITHTYELLQDSLAYVILSNNNIKSSVQDTLNDLNGYMAINTAIVNQSNNKVDTIASVVNLNYNEYTNTYTYLRTQLGQLTVAYNNISAYVYDSYAYSTSKLQQTANNIYAYVTNSYSRAISKVLQTANGIYTYVADSNAYTNSQIQQTANGIYTYVGNTYNNLQSYTANTYNNLISYVGDNYRKTGVKITSNDLQIGDIGNFTDWVNNVEKTQTDIYKVALIKYSYVYADTLSRSEQSYTPINNNRIVIGFKADMINATDKFTNAVLSAAAILSDNTTNQIPTNNCVVSNNFKTITIHYDGNTLVSNMETNPVIGIQIVYTGNDSSILFTTFIPTTIRSGALITVNTALGKIDARTAGFETLNNGFNTFYSTYNVSLGQFKDAWDVSSNKTVTWHETDPNSPSNPFTYVFNSVGNLQVKSDSITATVNEQQEKLTYDLFSPNLLPVNNMCDVYWKFIVPSGINEYYTKDITNAPYTRALYMPHIYMKTGKKYTFSFYVDKTLYLRYPGNTTEWQNAITENINTNTTGIPVWQIIAKVSNIADDIDGNWNNHTTLLSQFMGISTTEIDTTDYYTNKNIVRVHYIVEIPSTIDVNVDGSQDNIDGCFVQFAITSTNSDISIYCPKIEQHDGTTKYAIGGVNHSTTINQTSTQISSYVRTLDDKINETRVDILNSNINAYADTFSFYSSKRGDTDATLVANKIGYISSADGLVISKGKFSGEVNASKFIAGGNGSLHTVVSGDRFEFYSDRVSYSIKELKGDNIEGNYGAHNYDWPAAYFFYSEIDSKPQINLCLWGAAIGTGEYRVIDLEKATMTATGYVPVQINSGTLSLFSNPQTQTSYDIWWNGGSNPDLSTTSFYQDGKIGTTAPLLTTGTKFYKKIKTYNAALSKIDMVPIISFSGSASFNYTTTGGGLAIQANASQLYGAASIDPTIDNVEYYRYWGQFNGTPIPVKIGNPQDISMYVTNTVEQWAVYQVNEFGNIINTNKYIYVATKNSTWNTTTCINSIKTASGTSDNPMIYSAASVNLDIDSSLSVQSANRTIMRVNTYDLTSKTVYSVLQNNASYNVLNGLSFTKTTNDVENIATQYMSDKPLLSIPTPWNSDDYRDADGVFTDSLYTITGGPIATTSKDADWIQSGTSHFTHDYSRGAVYSWTYNSYTNTWPGSYVYNSETMYSAMQKSVFAVNTTIKAMNNVNIVDGLGNLSNAETTNVLTEVN